MARILGIDYGQKRVGIAVTDPLQIGASGLTTVGAHEVLQFLEGYFANEVVECIVVGWPVRMNKTDSEALKYVKQFISALRRRFPEMRIEIMDERFSSKIAMQALISGGMKKSERRKKENTDKMSAAIILQSFLEQESFMRGRAKN